MYHAYLNWFKMLMFYVSKGKETITARKMSLLWFVPVNFWSGTGSKSCPGAILVPGPNLKAPGTILVLEQDTNRY
jgi:hypothetical protein